MLESLRNQFLIAMPSLTDSSFSHTISYVCEHNDQGALGIVINRPLELSITELFRHLDIQAADSSSDQAVLAGGPVQTDRGFVLHDGGKEAPWGSTLQVSDEIWLTTSRDIIEAIAHGEGPDHSLIALGYAGWAPGQLEQELAQNAWLTSAADSDILFELPFEDRAQAAAARLGIDLNLIATEFGNA